MPDEERRPLSERARELPAPMRYPGASNIGGEPDRHYRDALADEVAALERENAELRENVKGEEYLHGITRAELEEARKDSERLDWLDALGWQRPMRDFIDEFLAARTQEEPNDGEG